MRVELYGHLRRGLGSNVIEVKIGERVHLKEALKALPEDIRGMILDERGSIRPGILVLVNGVDARSVYGFNVSISDSDKISLVPMIHGG